MPAPGRKVAIEIDQEHLYPTSSFAESRANPDAGSPRTEIPLPCDPHPHRVNTIGGQREPLAKRQVGGGEPQQPAAPITLHHGPRQPVWPTKKPAASLDMARADRLPDPAGADHLAFDLDGRKLVHGEPVLTDRCQPLGSAAPVAAQGEVAADPQFPEPECARSRSRNSSGDS